MIHPHTELAFVSPHVGWGVYATRPIPRGTITWVLDLRDRRLDAEQFAALPVEERHFCYQDREGLFVLAADHGRSINHACDPTCVSGNEDGFEVAIRDIRAGEQLTDDYGELVGFEPFQCGCTSTLCRGTIDPDAQNSFRTRRRRRQAREALALVDSVEQPLLTLLELDQAQWLDPAARSRLWHPLSPIGAAPRAVRRRPGSQNRGPAQLDHRR